MRYLPDIVTGSRFLAAAALPFIYYYGLGTVGGAWLFLAVLVAAVISDGVDGWLARRAGVVSDLGKLLDPAADAVLFVSAFACYSHAGLIPWWMTGTIAVREVLMNGVLRRVMLKKGVVVAAHWSGKTKTVVQSVVVITVASVYSLALSADSVREIVTAHWGGAQNALFAGALLVVSLSVGSFVRYLLYARRTTSELNAGKR